MFDYSKPVLRPAELPENQRFYSGESMRRVFVPGDLMQVEKMTMAERVDPGDIIIFRERPGRIVVHRVIARLEDGKLRTMGDNNPCPDFAPVAANAAVLRVVSVRRIDGREEPVSSGKEGITEFRRHRRQRWWGAELPRYAAGVCRRLWPFKRKLGAPVRFGDVKFFYVGETPVARRDAAGLVHWFSPWYRVIYKIDRCS